jgi:hypothetical protein
MKSYKIGGRYVFAVTDETAKVSGFSEPGVGSRYSDWDTPWFESQQRQGMYLFSKA